MKHTYHLKLDKQLIESFKRACGLTPMAEVLRELIKNFINNNRLKFDKQNLNKGE